MFTGWTKDGFGLAPCVASLSRQRRWAAALEVSHQARQANVGHNVFLASACSSAVKGLGKNMKNLLVLSREWGNGMMINIVIID